MEEPLENLGPDEEDRVHMIKKPAMTGTVTHSTFHHCRVKWDHGPETQEPKSKLQTVDEDVPTDADR